MTVILISMRLTCSICTRCGVKLLLTRRMLKVLLLMYCGRLNYRVVYMLDLFILLCLFTRRAQVLYLLNRR